MIMHASSEEMERMLNTFVTHTYVALLRCCKRR